MLEDSAAQRIGARLADSPQPSPGIARAQRLQSFRDGRRMMRKIVDQGDAGDLGLHFQATLHAAEAGKRLGDGGGIYLVVRRQRRGCSRVQDVVLAGKWKFKVAKLDRGKDQRVREIV